MPKTSGGGSKKPARKKPSPATKVIRTTASFSTRKEGQGVVANAKAGRSNAHAVQIVKRELGPKAAKSYSNSLSSIRRASMQAKKQGKKRGY